MKIIGFALLAVVGVTSAIKLPSYITPCKRTAIDLNECAMRNGQAAIPFIVQGDKTYKIPNMLPLKIPHIEFDASKTLKIAIENAEISGLEEAQIKDVKLDLNAQHFKFVVHIPRANLVGDYDIKGRILILPIQGQGPCNITIVDGLFNYNMYYNLVDRKGQKYLEVKRGEIDYETKRMHIFLANLFNGDKRLGTEMNKFINENWREVSKDIGPALTETISQIITQLLSSIFKKVTYNDFILE